MEFVYTCVLIYPKRLCIEYTLRQWGVMLKVTASLETIPRVKVAQMFGKRFMKIDCIDCYIEKILRDLSLQNRAI